MKVSPLYSALLIVLVLTAGIGRLNGETFYLAEQVRVGGDVRIKDLFLVPAAHELYDDALPVETEGRFVYLSHKGISGIVPGGLPGALIGSGIWLIPEGFSSVNNHTLGPLLRKIESLISRETGNGGDGFSISEADIIPLSGAQDLRTSRRGSGWFLETGDPDHNPVPVVFLKTPEKDRERVPAGSRITVYISRKGLIIEAEGRTNRGAEVGDRVPVTLTHTRRRFDALLTGPGEGEVRF